MVVAIPEVRDETASSDRTHLLPRDLYERDAWTWAKEQADALRASACNEPGWRDRLDWENLIREVDDLMRTEERAWISRCRNVISHLLKIQHGRSDVTVSHWMSEIDAWRKEMVVVLQDNPGMRSKLRHFLPTAWEHGRSIALGATAAEESDIPEDCPWNLIEIVGYDPYARRTEPNARLQPKPVKQAWPPPVWNVLAGLNEGWPRKQPPLSGFVASQRRAPPEDQTGSVVSAMTGPFPLEGGTGSGRGR